MSGWEPRSRVRSFASLRKLSRGVAEAARVDGARLGVGSMDLSAFRAFDDLVMGALDFVKSFKEFSVPSFDGGGPPSWAESRKENIVGATTTLEIFLYDAFRNQDD
jgi:ABC-type sugar transport system permease subunit